MKHIFNFTQYIIISIILFCSFQKNKALDSHSLYTNLIPFYKGLPVLVTGGCGFIGSHLVEKLVELGANVSILDDLSTGSRNNIATVADKITFFYGNINDLETCLAATQNKKIIFHLAAFVSVPASTENPQKCHNTNIIGTQNILEAARINHVTRFVFSSTCATYGESISKCTEQTQPNPISPYGFSKLIGELYCKEYAQIFNIETVVMRYFNVYGPRQDPQGCYAGVITKFIHNMKHNLPLTIFGDGTQTRDYVPVEMIVDANILLGACEKQFIQGEIFNIATGNNMNIFELIEILKQNYPLYNNDIIFMPARPGDAKHIAADCSKYNNLHNHVMLKMEKQNE